MLSPGMDRRRAGAFLGGAALGLALGAALSREFIPVWAQARPAFSFAGGPAGALRALPGNLRDFFLGSADSVPYLGLSAQPSAPRWAWPLLIAGLWACRSRAWLLAWVGLGLAPLAATHFGNEPNRAVAAWPALALIAGCGWSELWSRAEGRGWRWAAPLLIALPLAGFADEALAFRRSMNANYARAYGRSESMRQAGTELRALSESGGVECLSHLELQRGFELRFHCGPLPLAPPGAPTLAWIPDEYLHRFSREAHGGLSASGRIQPKPAPLILLELKGRERDSLRASDSLLRSLGRKPCFTMASAGISGRRSLRT
jgi:hypothetical protein